MTWGGKRLFGLVLAGIFLISLVFLKFLFWPLRTEIKQDRLLVQEKQQAIEAVEEFTNAHRDMEAFHKELEQRERVAVMQLPDHIEQGQLMSFLQDKAAGCHLAILALKPENVRQADGISELPMLLETQSNYFQLLDFLDALEHGERLWKVDDLVLQQEAGLLHCRMRIAAYALE
jgi:Tfp pilus assembly protein PilO